MAADDTPIHDELVMEQFDREVAEYVAQFEAEDTDAYCNEVDATAERGDSWEFRAAGLLLALLGGIITAGLFVTAVGIVRGWIS